MAVVPGSGPPVKDESESGRGSWMEALLPGARIGVRVKDSPSCVHGMTLGWPSSDMAWVVRTPHDLEYIEDLTEKGDCFALTGLHRCGVLVGSGDEVVGFEVPLVDDALLEFVVRARRYARTAQRDEPWLYRRRDPEPSHYVAYCESRRTAFTGDAGGPPDVVWPSLRRRSMH